MSLMFNQIIEYRIFKRQSAEEGAHKTSNDQEGHPGKQAGYCKGKVHMHICIAYMEKEHKMIAGTPPLPTQ